MAFVMDFRSSDFLYDTVDIAIWSDVEIGLAVTAGSLATLRPLYRKLALRFGFSQSDPETATKRSSQPWYRTASHNRPRRSGPFSLATFTRNETRSGRISDDNFALENARPVKLRDDESLDHRDGGEKGFSTWTVRGGDGGSEESLNAKAPQGLGITRQTDVFLERSYLHGGGP